jgi:hypothetical protein
MWCYQANSRAKHARRTGMLGETLTRAEEHLRWLPTGASSAVRTASDGARSQTKGGSLAYELLYNCEHLSLHLVQQLMQTCAVFYMGALASDASVTAVLDLQWCFSTLQLVDVAGFDLKVCSNTDGTRKLILQSEAPWQPTPRKKIRYVGKMANSVDHARPLPRDETCAGWCCSDRAKEGGSAQLRLHSPPSVRIARAARRSLPAPRKKEEMMENSPQSFVRTETTRRWCGTSARRTVASCEFDDGTP